MAQHIVAQPCHALGVRPAMGHGAAHAAHHGLRIGEAFEPVYASYAAHGCSAGPTLAGHRG